MLRELERASGIINEAWLNRAGTQLAVVWAADGSSKTRMETLTPILSKRELIATELTGRTRSQALKDFKSGTGWLQADAVDLLSEEEAGIIASRLVDRVNAKTPLSEKKASTLRSALAARFKANFIGSPERPRPSAEQEQAALLNDGARYLSETELAALRDALASGFRPLPDEK